MSGLSDTNPGELREDIGLKTGKKSSRCFTCSDECLGGAKCINISFGVLTALITSALVIQIYYGDFQVVPHGSVATDFKDCSEIGTMVLKQNGNAVDAAIASAFCLAVVNPHVTGLDAEGIMLIYNHRTRVPPDVIDFPRNSNSKIDGLLPRLVIGLAYIHQQYGKLSWKELVLPAAKIARRGFLVPNSLSIAIKLKRIETIFGSLQPGEIYSNPHLANTLENIANIPTDELYNFITLENTPFKSTAINLNFRGFNIFVPDGPSPGPELLQNLRRIAYLNVTSEDVKAELLYRVAEITQASYDSLNISSRFHEGKATNIAVMDKDDNYVSLSFGMYDYFGSRILSRYGYLLDVKNTTQQYCLRLPIIITDAEYVCGRRLSLGVSNLVIASQVIPSLLVASENVIAAVENPRFQLNLNNVIEIEDEHKPNFSDEDLQYLETLGHLQLMKEPYESCNVVEKIGDLLSSHSDSRGGGISSRFK